MTYISVVIFGFLVTTAASVPQQEMVDVTLVRSEQDELEASVVWGNEGMELWIEAKPNKLAIRSSASDRDLFFYGEKKEGSGIFYVAQGRSFVTMETINPDGTVTKTDYVIPNLMMERAKEAFEQRKIARVLSAFDRENARHSTEAAIHELVYRSEVWVLQETARILGEEHGVSGRDNKGALLFYMTVLQLSKEREGRGPSSDRTRDIRDSVRCPNLEDTLLTPAERRGTFSLLQTTTNGERTKEVSISRHLTHNKM